MIRTQLYIDEKMHARLRELAEKQQRTVSDLVRDALRRVYGRDGGDRRATTLKAVEGLWSDREDLTETDEYVRRLRKDTRRTRNADR